MQKSSYKTNVLGYVGENAIIEVKKYSQKSYYYYCTSCRKHHFFQRTGLVRSRCTTGPFKNAEYYIKLVE
jgi:hypothetical protein